MATQGKTHTKNQEPTKNVANEPTKETPNEQEATAPQEPMFTMSMKDKNAIVLLLIESMSQNTVNRNISTWGVCNFLGIPIL